MIRTPPLAGYPVFALLMLLLLCVPAPGFAAQPEPGPTDGVPSIEAAGGEAAVTGDRAASTDKTDDLNARLDALLAETRPSEDYTEHLTCLQRQKYRHVEILSERYLLFYRGDRYWLNRLKHPCPSLRFDDVPVFEQRGGSSLCESDRFYPMNSLDLEAGLGPTGRPLGAHGVCFLGPFESISPEQAELLRQETRR